MNSSMLMTQLLIKRDDLRTNIEKLRMSKENVSHEVLKLKQQLFAVEVLLKE